jgi:hypothetical protein
MTRISTLHKKWSKQPSYKAAYETPNAERQLAEQWLKHGAGPIAVGRPKA